MEAGDFNDVSQFLTSQYKSANTDLMKIFLMKRDENGNIDKHSARMALIKMAEQLFSIDISSFHLESDTEMIRDAARLERLTSQLAAFDRLGEKYKLWDSLEDDKREALFLRIKSLRNIAAYYTVRKELITDSLYSSRYNYELSMDTGKANTPEEKKVAGLLVRSYALGKALMMDGNASQKAIRNIGTPVIRTAKGNNDLNEITVAMTSSIYSSENLKKLVSEGYKKSDETAGNILINFKNQQKVPVNESLIFMFDDHILIDEQEKEEDKKEEKEEKITGFGDHELSAILTSDELTPLKGTRDMAAVRNNIQAIQALMSEKMPPVKRGLDGKIDRENEKKTREIIDSTCIMVVMLYSRLSESIKQVTKKYATAYPDLCAMLRKFEEGCNTERDSFREKTLEFRSLLLEDPGFAEGKDTWIDALKFNRSVFYDLDNDKDLVVGRHGEGASLVYSITRKVEASEDNPDGTSTVFFRKKDTVPPLSNKELIKNVLDESGIDGETLPKAKALIDMITSGKKSLNNFFNIVDKAKKKKTAYELISDRMIAEFKLKDKDDKPIAFSEEEKKKLGLMLLELHSSFSKRCIAMQKNLSPQIQEKRNLSDRNVATSRLATLLGVQSMICDSRTAVIKKDGKLIEGNIMEGTGGTETIGKKTPYTMNAISQLFQLQIFDIICGQVDRHFGNFHGIIKDGKIVAIKGIDNDMAFGLLSATDLINAGINTKGYNRMRPLYVEVMMALPTSFANRIMSLERPYLEQVLGDILNKEEMDALVSRLDMIKDYIRYLPLYMGCENAVWNEETKQISYKDEDADEELRQLKCLSKIDEYVGRRKYYLEDRSCFDSGNIEAMGEIEFLIKERREQLLQKGDKK